MIKLSISGNKMHLSQIWSDWHNTGPRRYVCHGAQYYQRKNLHLLLVLVCFAFFRFCSRFDMESGDDVFTRQKSQVQWDGIRIDMPGKIESLEGINSDKTLQLYGLAVFALSIEKYGQYYFPRSFYWSGGRVNTKENGTGRFAERRWNQIGLIIYY